MVEPTSSGRPSIGILMETRLGMVAPRTTFPSDPSTFMTKETVLPDSIPMHSRKDSLIRSGDDVAIIFAPVKIGSACITFRLSNRYMDSCFLHEG